MGDEEGGGWRVGGGVVVPVQNERGRREKQSVWTVHGVGERGEAREGMGRRKRRMRRR